MAIINGTSGADKIKGTDDADVISGLGGNDDIDGRRGNDSILGGEGNDTLVGWDGNDTVKGGADDDVIWGNKEADELHGDGGNDDVDGGSGNDTLFGNDGDDTLDGVSGDDELFGGDGNDDIEGGSGEDTADGGAGNDMVDGQSGHDSLKGGEGDDTIIGGSGMDTALFDGSVTGYAISQSGNDIIITDIDMSDGDDGTDVIRDDVEFVQFGDYLLDLTGNNNAPVAVIGGLTTNEDTAFTFGVNVLDFDGDAIMIDSISVTLGGLPGGTLTPESGPIPGVTGLGSSTLFEFSFDPMDYYQFLGLGESYTEKLTITTKDVNGGTTTQTFDLVITGENDPPVSLDQPVVADEEDGPFIINLADQVNDPDVNDALTFTNIRITSGQTPVPFVVIGNGIISIDPVDAGLDEGQSLITSISYKVSDGELSDTGIVPLTINGADDAPPPPNSPPVASPLSVTADEEDGLVALSLPSFVSDPDVGDVLTITTLTVDFGSGPVNVPFTGGVTAGDGGELRFDPVFFGLDEGVQQTFALNYTVVDDSGASASNVITLDLTGHTPGAGNNPPVANSVPSGVGAVPEEIIVDDPGTTSLTFNISGLVSDPDTGDTLTITVDNFNVGSDENGDPITVPFTFDQGTGDVTIQFADLNVPDGTSILGTLNYSVTDGTDTASGQVTYNFVNPAEPAPPQALTLDFEPFANPFGAQIDITDGTYLGFSFDGSAIVVETDEIGAGGRDTDNGITRGQTTVDGDNVLVGTFSTTEVQVGVDRNDEPVFETVPDDDFAILGPDASFGISDGGQFLISLNNAFPPPDLPTNLPNDGVANPFDLDGLSLNVASGGPTTVTITTYAIDVVGTPNPDVANTTDYSLDYVVVDTFEFTVDSETPATQIDFNDPSFSDDLGNNNSAAFDDIAAITVTTDTGVAVVLDDVFVTV